MIADSHRFYGTRVGSLFAAVLVIFAGLALRRYGYTIGLPFMVVKYGGSVLWGSMVCFLMAMFMGAERRSLAAPLACAVAILVELIRLVHFPALDAFRATTTGALLLGRVFSLWNIACYLVGILLAAFIARRFWLSSRF
ncbi:DUF2809 domain-containing protein [Agrobacterium tumefaciens]|uniref:ribosomal maturation YjgA family protein n=1 Tax=Agrobacterium tumefaciens TaxID=358 RepID=UPI0021D1D2CC|nr:DUF2809 domain-containing protein [Agrobacterium tumefaciens]UXS01768.1 DUF2809 domain-containing protein [Agrobacterium tumefaciens]